jgi:23S rRNA (adenine2503-C2)-methyltransferase
MVLPVDFDLARQPISDSSLHQAHFPTNAGECGRMPEFEVQNSAKQRNRQIWYSRPLKLWLWNWAVSNYITTVMVDVRSQTQEDLQKQFVLWQQPAYRVAQLLEWLYAHRVEGWEQMSNLPKELRLLLQQTYTIQSPVLARKQGSRDTTEKFLWRLSDGALIESVLIPASASLFGEASDRHTLCVSTQVGCAYGCKFCASGLDGWKRNLQPSEIVNQVLAVEQAAKPASDARLINNLVIMGMGEPLANYDNLLRALRILNAPWGGGIGARKITISTSGLAPQIRRLADEAVQFRLAISLHGATDETRSKIMPVNNKYPLKDLVAACEYYQEKQGRMITFEYILIAGVNDAPEQAPLLARLARRLNAKVNLIPYNKVDGLPWSRPEESAQEIFLDAVTQNGAIATLRREKGHDIDAACGQLRLKTERAEMASPA